MKTKIALLFTALFAFSAQAFAPNKAELAKFPWQDLALSQQQTSEISPQTAVKIDGVSNVIGYKIPANQGTLKINISSQVTADKTIFVPNLLVLDSHFAPALNYPAAQFKFHQERGFAPAQYAAELSLTPTANQDFIYLLVYTTEKELQGKTTVTHPAKLLAKAKGNQPPAIADIEVAHSAQGKIVVEVDGVQSQQIIGLNLPTFNKTESAPQVVGNAPKAAPAASKVTQKVESSTEKYFNQAVLEAIKAKDLNKAMNLVNEAEQLGLKQPRQLFLKHIAVQK